MSLSDSLLGNSLISVNLTGPLVVAGTGLHHILADVCPVDAGIMRLVVAGGTTPPCAEASQSLAELWK